MFENDLTRHISEVISVVSGKSTPILNELETPIVQSWRRCLEDFGLDPSRTTKTRVLTQGELRSYREPLDVFLRIARAGLERLYHQISDAGYIVLLCDAKGVTVDAVINQSHDKELHEAGLYLGSVWGESEEGTCGVGTCITTQQSLTIHKSEHFRSRHIGLTCTDAPILDPYGNLMAVLNASALYSSDDKKSQKLVYHLINHATRMIENALFLNEFKSDYVVRFSETKELAEVTTDNLIAFNSFGQIIAANKSAIYAIGNKFSGNFINNNISELFDISIEQVNYRIAKNYGQLWQIRAIDTGRQFFSLLRAPELQVLSTVSSVSRNTVSVARYKNGSVLTLDHLAGSDPRMAGNVVCAKRVMNKNISILLNGETGTGKEAFAQAVHNASDRAHKPFVALNCASIPESLIESELFGYMQGAFTGARNKGMRGKILQSDGGTFFLDEIGDMPLNLQTRLLRVLAENEVVPLGGETPIRVNLHVICATHRNIDELIASGAFREDLYYRLNGITLALPSLRERSDKGMLIEQALVAELDNSSEKMRIDEEAFMILLNYHWPGNIRQLRNAIRYALAVCDGDMIRVMDLPPDITRSSSSARPLMAPSEQSVRSEGLFKDTADAVERESIVTVLKRNRWNISTAVKELGISRSTIYRKMEKHNIVPPNLLN